MKKIFSLMAMAAMAASVFASCTKDDTGKDNNGDNDGDNNGGEEVVLPASLSGSEYFVIQLGSEEYEAIESKIALNLMPYKIGEGDDAPDGIALYVWDGTYEGATSSGLNSYGFTDGWVALSVAYGGWSGAGYTLTDGGVADLGSQLSKFNSISGNESSWYFHFAYKSDQKTSHVGAINWAGTDYKFVFGDPEGEFNDGVENRILPVGGEYQSGEWNEYEICLKDTPLDFSAAASSVNLFWFLSGGTTGTTLDLDAIFYYKK